MDSESVYTSMALGIVDNSDLANYPEFATKYQGVIDKFMAQSNKSEGLAKESLASEASVFVQRVENKQGVVSLRDFKLNRHFVEPNVNLPNRNLKLNTEESTTNSEVKAPDAGSWSSVGGFS